jgi:hypothetical protein
MFAGAHSFLLLPHAVCIENLDGSGRELQRARGPLSLHFGRFEAIATTFQSATHSQRAALVVNLRPLQPE